MNKDRMHKNRMNKGVHWKQGQWRDTVKTGQMFKRINNRTDEEVRCKQKKKKKEVLQKQDKQRGAQNRTNNV